MKKRITVVLVAIALTVLLSGCAGQVGLNNTSTASAAPHANTTIPSVPTQAPRPGPSMLFSMDKVTWFQYFVNVPMEDFTRHQKLEVTYEHTTYGFSNTTGRYDIPVKRTTIEIRWLNEDNWNVITNDESVADQRVIRFHNGPIMVNGHLFSGVGLTNLSEDMPFRRYLDVSTRFDSGTDNKMKIVSYDTAKYIGEPYNCTVFDLTNDGDTFRVWKNESLPLPLKIIATYKEPEKYADHPNHANVTGPFTYELTGWTDNAGTH